MKRKFRSKRPFNGGSKNFFLLLLIGGLAILALAQLHEITSDVATLNYSQLLTKVEQNQVKKITISGGEATGQLTDGSRFEAVVPRTQEMLDRLREHNVDISLQTPTSPLTLFLIIGGILGLFALFFIFIQFRRMRGGGGGGGPNVFGMGKSKARMFMPSAIKEKFSSVAGAEEAKEDLKDVIDFLKNPGKFKKLGAKITRGVLMVGEPGTGKTLLARAVAGEANCPFFSISGSDFIEVFVGVGASRVRDLFAQARRHAPCIIFIDEIDAVGRHRDSSYGGGHDERVQTLNQLLAEMDGFENTGEPVIVIAATNRADVLDKALLRPGRFDRRVHVPIPTLRDRRKILAVHAEGVKMSPDIDLDRVARGTPGFTGADLASLINEAAIRASKHNRSHVIMEDVEDARDKIMMGRERRGLALDEHELQRIAYHESGHALVRLLTPEGTDPLHKLTILPRGEALGVAYSLPERDRHLMYKEPLLADICMALGGRIAEMVKFHQASTGASNDFEKASRIARAMVVELGMSDAVGPVVYKQGQGEFAYSQKTAELIDAEVRRILDECYQKAETMIRQNLDKLDALAQAVLEKETLYADEIYELLGIEPRETLKLI